MTERRVLRTIIVDDEAPARRRVRRLLRDEDDVEVVAECPDGARAVQAMLDLAPDLVLLDVAMPAMDGLEVLAAVGAERLPAVIFVTAYDRYAVQAFEHHAVDYLLKPVDADRFHRAIGRARERLTRHKARDDGGDALSRQLRALLAAWPKPGRYPERLFVAARGRGLFVSVADIAWVEAQRNQVALHVGRATHRMRTTLTRLATRLDPHRFRRISRSALVNVARVREIQPWFHGDAVAILDTGERLTVSRTYRKSFAST